VGWGCFGADAHPEKVEQIIEESKEFPNITAAVFDDFRAKAKYLEKKGLPPVDEKKLWEVKERLNNNPVRKIDMWMVLYTHEFGVKPESDLAFKKYMDPFNGIIMWNWEEKNAHQIPEKFEILKKLTPNQRRMFGCYLYNFGESKQATGESVKWQLDFYREKILAGEAEGVVLHTNTMADLDYEAYDVALEWMAKHGDEEI
jgi:hypothetical protein